ncbi:MAG: glutamate mutase L [Candidatus Binatia bacterium]
MTTDDRIETLRPRQPNIFLDSSYLLYAVGLLSQQYPDIALRVFTQYITPVA